MSFSTLESLKEQFEHLTVDNPNVFNLYIFLIHNMDILKREKFNKMAQVIYNKSVQLISEMNHEKHEHLILIIRLFLQEYSS